MDYFIGKNIVIHTKTENFKINLLEVAKEINKQGKYVMVANYDQEKCSTHLENVDVHSIMLGDQASINYTMSCFKHRQRYNRETWILYSKVFTIL